MIQATDLANGVRIVSHRLPSRRSVSLGIWLANGSRYESAEQHGYSHLLEHLLFKDNAYYDANTLATSFEAMGGRINAHTGRELMVLHGTVPAEALAELAETFLAMLLYPSFGSDDVAVERDVVLQEIALQQSDPLERLEEAGFGMAWCGHPLGRSVLGDPAVIRAAQAEALHGYWLKTLTGARLCVTAAGDVDHDALVDIFATLEGLPQGAVPHTTPPPFKGGNYTQYGDHERAHLLWIFPVPGIAENNLASVAVSNHLLGGGIASRLFVEVRAHLGLTYAIHSRLEQYGDCGLWLIETQCDGDKAAACRAAVESTVSELAEVGPSADELAVSRRHLRAELVLEDDDTEAHMQRLGREAMYLGHHPKIGERSAGLERVNASTVKTLLGTAWADKLFLQVAPAK